MTHQYNITGMTCGNCVAKVKSALLKLGDVTTAAVQLAPPQATITMQKHIATSDLQHAVDRAGAYNITEADAGMQHAGHMNSSTEAGSAASWFVAYKPILLIGAFIIGVTLLTEVVQGGLELERWMQNFMAAFLFSHSKLQ